MRRLAILLVCIGVFVAAVLWVSQDRWKTIAATGDGAFAIRITFGYGDTSPQPWDGSLDIENGHLARVEGWRIWENEDDSILQPSPNAATWKLQSRRERRYRIALTTPPPLQYWEEPPGEPSPSGFYFFGEGSDAAQFNIQTKQGNFAFRLADVPWGTPVKMFGGKVEIARVPSPTRLSPDRRESDFPSVAVAPDGAVWSVWQSYSGGRDEIHLAKNKDGRWMTYSPLPGVSGDVWRPQVAVDPSGVVWVIWSQQVDGNWDIYALAHHGDRVDNPIRLSNAPGPDINVRVAIDSMGRVYAVWQGADGPYSRIYLRYLEGGRWSERYEISAPGIAANNWEPSAAADQRGNLYVAWDTYRNGNYDVYFRSFTAPGTLGAEREVASSSKYEAHASVACDHRNRVWIAWESGLPNWGKDLATAVPGQGPGTALGDYMEVKTAVFDGASSSTTLLDPQTAFEPNERSRSRYPELTVDSDDRPWLTFRHITLKGRTEHYSTTRGLGHWASYVTCYNGSTWSRAEMLPSSVGRISSFASLAPQPHGGGVWAVWNGDGRPWLDLEKPINNQVFAAAVQGPAATAQKLQQRVDVGQQSTREDAELSDLARIRSYRVTARGKTYRIVRGDLHRHAEFSRDQGGGRDGSFLDFYRYMLDAASMDYGAITEHSNGFFEYWDWLLQKSCDLFNRPGYAALYAYERTATYPAGHRNVIHARRGVPLVDFFLSPSFSGERPPVDADSRTLLSNDTTLLHERLRESGGISIPHTTATAHGTDWKQYDPQVEPVVEIYQGLRSSYERLDAPRAVKPGSKDFHEPGLVSNAWAQGLRLGVIASSDHVSTHTSYAMVLVENPTREGILDAIRSRHTYGATDNIILDCRIGDHVMGDEFAAHGGVTLSVKAEGAAPVKRVTVIRNNTVVYTAEPGTRRVSLEFHDTDKRSRRDFYYVRLEQADGQLAWSSPFWVTSP